MLEAEEGFNTFIRGVYFDFGQAACREFLAAGDPVNGAIEQDDESRKGASFEEEKF